MVGLDTEWSVKINLGQEEFMYHGLPPHTSTTLAKLADYAIAQGWIRTAPPARGDGKIAIRGSILRRLMAATGEGDRAVASTLQPLTSQYSTDGNESESWSDIIEINDDLFEDEDLTSADPVDDSDFSVTGWVPDFEELSGGADAFGIEEAGEVPEYFDPGVEDFDEPFVEAVPIDADLDDFELVPNPQWDDMDMFYADEEVIEDPFMVDQSDSDYYDMVQPFGDGGGLGN
ncbi:Rsp5p-dependent ubiquitination, sorting of cargo proteins at the multivesicular body, partial [Perkinsus olseni]